MSRSSIALLALMLIVGLVAGFFLGRAHLEHQWSQPLLDAPARPASSGGGAAITPGTRVLRPMPLRRSREALAGLSQGDAVVVPVGSISRDDDKVALHLTLENHGACPVASVRGVAYGFDARGGPASLRPDGSVFVAFEASEAIPPGGKAQVTLALAQVDQASIALAHVDEVSCAPGPPWRARR